MMLLHARIIQHEYTGRKLFFFPVIIKTRFILEISLKDLVKLIGN